MATFYISRKKQFSLIIDGSGGHDTESRERRLRMGQAIKDMRPEEGFEPSDLYSYDLSLLLERLEDEQHADAFEVYLNLY